MAQTEEITYLDDKGHEVPQEQAVLYIRRVIDENGKLVSEQFGLPQKQNESLSLSEAVNILTHEVKS